MTVCWHGYSWWYRQRVLIELLFGLGNVWKDDLDASRLLHQYNKDATLFASALWIALIDKFNPASPEVRLQFLARELHLMSTADLTSHSSYTHHAIRTDIALATWVHGHRWFHHRRARCLFWPGSFRVLYRRRSQESLRRPSLSPPWPGQSKPPGPKATVRAFMTSPHTNVSRLVTCTSRTNLRQTRLCFIDIFCWVIPQWCSAYHRGIPHFCSVYFIISSPFGPLKMWSIFFINFLTLKYCTMLLGSPSSETILPQREACREPFTTCRGSTVLVGLIHRAEGLTWTRWISSKSLSFRLSGWN